MKHVCPNWPSESALTGCGHEFEQEPDWEGWVDCPECGLAFNAEQAAKERNANL